MVAVDELTLEARLGQGVELGRRRRDRWVATAGTSHPTPWRHRPVRCWPWRPPRAPWHRSCPRCQTRGRVGRARRGVRDGTEQRHRQHRDGAERCVPRAPPASWVSLQLHAVSTRGSNRPRGDTRPPARRYVGRRGGGEGSGQDERGPGGAERRGGGVQCGAGGDHVVDHHHTPRCGARVGHELRRVKPLVTGAPGLCGGAAAAFEQLPARQTEPGGDATGDQLGLVEAPAAAPSRARRRPCDDVEPSVDREVWRAPRRCGSTGCRRRAPQPDDGSRT